MKKLFAIFFALFCAAYFVLPLQAQDPYLMKDESWISLSGTVVTAGANTFELDYGEGIVTVEMDDWDWYSEAYPILSGDRVTVYGRVDDDLYETTSIEASSVYVKGFNTYFYASAADEESAVPYVSVLYADADLQFTGIVTSIDGREFTIDTGTRTMKVDTIMMPYNPMDDKGFQKVRKGDYVQVTGDIDVDVFEKTELMADTITTLVKDRTKNKS